MKVPRICLFLLLAGVLAQGHTAWAEGWSLGSLVPSTKSDKAKSSRNKGKQPSTMEQLGTGTKKVVSTTTDLVTLKWLLPKKTPAKPDNPSVNQWRKKEPPKKSFFDFLSPPKEPPPPQTLGEWMAQKRLEP
ncbi:MAG: hypothetical protein ABIK89_16915 [Planctomycetota bacterium]